MSNYNPNMVLNTKTIETTNITPSILSFIRNIIMINPSFVDSLIIEKIIIQRVYDPHNDNNRVLPLNYLLIYYTENNPEPPIKSKGSKTIIINTEEYDEFAKLINMANTPTPIIPIKITNPIMELDI